MLYYIIFKAGVTEAEQTGGLDVFGEDLTADYHDMAVAVQGLGFLESGITDQLNHFSNTLLEFSALLRHTVCPVNLGPVDPLLIVGTFTDT